MSIIRDVCFLSSKSCLFFNDTAPFSFQVYSTGGAGIGLMETSRLLMKEGGVRAFYSGVGPTLCRAFPACAALFVGYEYSKAFLTKVTN